MASSPNSLLMSFYQVTAFFRCIDHIFDQYLCLQFIQQNKIPMWFWTDQNLRYTIYLVSSYLSADRTKGTVLDPGEPAPNATRTHCGYAPPCFQSPKSKERRLQPYLLAGEGVLHPLGGGGPRRPWSGGRESPPRTGGKRSG